MKKRWNRRRAVKKISRRRFRGKKQAKYSASSNQLTFMSKNLLPLPPMYRTRMSAYCEIQMANNYLPINGNNTVPGYCYGIVNLNKMFQPFLTGLGGTTNILATASPPGITVLPGITANTIGYNTLVNSTAYLGYRVYASRIRLYVSVQQSSDAIEAVLFPIDPNSLASIVAGGNDFEVNRFSTQPFAKIMNFNLSQTSKPLENFVSLPKLMGCTKRAFQDDLSGQFTAQIYSEPNLIYNWVFCMKTCDNANLSNQVQIRIKVDYYVELRNLSDGRLV